MIKNVTNHINKTILLKKKNDGFLQIYEYMTIKILNEKNLIETMYLRD